VRQVLINAVTGEVGPGTQVTGNPTYRDLDSTERERALNSNENYWNSTKCELSFRRLTVDARLGA